MEIIVHPDWCRRPSFRQAAVGIGAMAAGTQAEPVEWIIQKPLAEALVTDIGRKRLDVAVRVSYHVNRMTEVDSQEELSQFLEMIGEPEIVVFQITYFAGSLLRSVTRLSLI